ncbi:MAG TPA: glycoside hydrolase family 25 protein [Candidatus Limnocylindrales bacterium]|nr:glycoside hydrolase family 25 protein [Candidatus Limnocylindrales bacterium]
MSVTTATSRAAPGSRRAGVRRGAARPVLALGLGLLVALASVGPAAAAASRPGGGPADAARFDAATAVLEGIDVSQWQGAIDWAAVAAAGKAFAILKATDGKPATNGTGLFVDPTYATNHAAAKANGLWTGAYHFARPDPTPGDAVREADHFADVMNLGSGDLNPALDIETNGGLTPSALTAWVIAFLDRVTARIGARPMIYTSPSFWSTSMGNTQALADAGYRTLWVAHWTTNASPTVPASNWGGNGWTFWQYSSTGSVPGIAGDVDLDRFNGLDLRTQAYSIFQLGPTPISHTVKQGAASTSSIPIRRTNFSDPVTLEVSGLPDGFSATFGDNPTPAAGASLTITAPEEPTAAALGIHPLTVTGTASGITSTLAVDLVVVDGIAPAVTAPFTAIQSTSVLGAAGVPVKVTWTASDPSGVTSGALQRSLNGGPWSGVQLASPTATSSAQTLAIGTASQQRSRATDRLANTSAWQPGPTVRTTLIQQSATSITYSGTWRTVSASSASGGSLRYATASGASATYRFTGSSVAWVAARGPGRGQARVYVDGVHAATVNLAASTGQSRAIVFARNWRVNASHTLKVVVVGTAGHPRVDVDAFVRLSLS